MITDIKNERDGYGFFWLIVAFLVGQMMNIPVKGNVIGRNDVLIERLREFVEKEKQDTL